VPDDVQENVVGKHDVSRLQSVGLTLFGHQKVPGDVEFLKFRIAGDLDDLHPVPKRRRDGVRGC